MSDLLPMPKHMVWKKVAVNIYALCFTAALMYGLDLFRHKSWHWGEVVYLALVLALNASMENFNYYGWRNKRWPETKINLDRD